MPPDPYRAVSFDLWFTTLSFGPEAPTAWREARERCLQEVLLGADGRPPTLSAISAAERELRGSLPPGVRFDTLGPAQFLSLLVEELGGRFRGDAVRAARLYSAAGLRESPPVINPEVVQLCGELGRRGISTLCVTNTARHGESWAEFFREHDGPRFDHIVTSCEVGKWKPDPEIFHEASRRVGLPCEAILHIGDRWDLDVAGARSVGMGRALYRGLWSQYPEPQDQEISRRLDDQGEDVVRIDRMEELLERELFRPA